MWGLLFVLLLTLTCTLGVVTMEGCVSGALGFVWLLYCLRF